MPSSLYRTRSALLTYPHSFLHFLSIPWNLSYPNTDLLLLVVICTIPSCNTFWFHLTYVRFLVSINECLTSYPIARRRSRTRRRTHGWARWTSYLGPGRLAWPEQELHVIRRSIRCLWLLLSSTVLRFWRTLRAGSSIHHVSLHYIHHSIRALEVLDSI